METKSPQAHVDLQTSPDRYRHLKLEVEGPIARVKIDIQEENGLRPGYELKLNSYDLGVDIELADAVQRLRFEQPQVSCVVVTSAREDGVFSSGANIFMLGSSAHGFKVNFCKFTNETRLYIEDATEFSGQTYIAALNGLASGGGYELPLACKEIYLIDDRRSAVSLPEVPYLGVLPGTGGLTRVVDKRCVRRDLADIFCTLAEGVKGKKALKWGLVDGIFPTSKFDEKVNARVAEIAGDGHTDRKGVTLKTLEPTVDEDGISYTHVQLRFGKTARTAHLIVNGPSDVQDLPADPSTLGCDWYPLAVMRELDNLLLRLRFNHPEIGLVLLQTRGDAEKLLAVDAQLVANTDNWFVNEVLLNMKRVLKRLDLSAKSFFALIETESCFAGSFFELALAADRSYMLEDEGVSVAISPLNGGLLPMSNGLTRLQSRFFGDHEKAARIAAESRSYTGEEADEQGLITMLVDELDWDDETRLAIEERASFSPDALTGMEASLRWAGPETMETKIFGRLSAWQNWIFQRPNAVGPKGALTLYGQPESAEYDFRRT
jgi:benzoyl-CoA-dihydrodiol lyase